jgi:transposase
MPSPADAPICHIVDCDQSPTHICDRCEKPCCEQHARWVTIERRVERIELARYPRSLSRIPTRSETYLLCAHCTKNRQPFAGRADR